MQPCGLSHIWRVERFHKWSIVKAVFEGRQMFPIGSQVALDSIAGSCATMRLTIAMIERILLFALLSYLLTA